MSNTETLELDDIVVVDKCVGAVVATSETNDEVPQGMVKIGQRDRPRLGRPTITVPVECCRLLEPASRQL
jgi:hypothetical protein